MMKKSKIEKLLTELSANRPVFHSEADFQHELGWLLHMKFPQASIRLEKPYEKENGKTEYVDIFADIGGKKYFIELKYKTKKLKLEQEINREKFYLKDQGAQDCGRYDFWKDVSRIESKISENNNSFGYVIFLTNDYSYLKSPREKTYSYNFRTTDKRDNCSGNFGYLGGYNNGRKEKVIIKNSYKLKWQDYGNCGFKFLLLEIK